MQGPSTSSRGWGGKFYRSARAFLDSATPQALAAQGLRKGEAAKIIEGKAFVLAQLERGNWDALPGLRRLWLGLWEQAKRRAAIEVDGGVTFDLARIIRLEDSLHGDTGLVAKKIGAKTALARFDPLREALSVDPKRLASVVPNSDVKFQMADQTFELKADQTFELPAPAALALLCKDRAQLAPP
jgi:DNA primase small subunit